MLVGKNRFDSFQPTNPYQTKAAPRERPCNPLTQQTSYHTGHLVGVGQNGHASLHQHLVLGHIGAFLSEIGIHDAT